MSDLEYEVLDELYFVQSYSDLRNSLGWDDQMLRETLGKLFEKKWIRCYQNPTHELFGEEIDMETKYHTYFYLASKAGLFAHNGSDHNGG